MFTLNAFVSIPELANNTVNAIATFGELSVPAKTYTKDIRNYTHVDNPGIELVTVTQTDDNANVVQNPDARVSKQALDVASYFLEQYKANRIPLPTAKQTLIKAVSGQFINIRNILIGNILNGDSTGKRLIDYIRYDFVVENKIWRCTLWFSDKAFRTQYPLYEIVVVPPIADIMRLNDTPATVLEAISGVTLEFTINRVNEITKDYKSTALHVYNTVWHDPAGSKQTMDVKWTLVIYGQGGIDQDSIKDAIREYLAAHGAGVDWPKIFPDLFSENEFLIMPYWGEISTLPEDIDDGLYSSITGLKVVANQNSRLLPMSYKTGASKQTHIDTNFELVATTYRGINLGVVSNPNNKENILKFSQLFPDYMSVPTDKNDFARMRDKTQKFIIKLLEVLEIARDWNAAIVLPADFSRTIKANREYIGFEYEGFNYYVLTRIGYNKEI